MSLNSVLEQDSAVRFLRCVVDGRWVSPLLLVGDDGVGKRLSVTEAFLDSVGDDPVQRRQLAHNAHPDFVVVSAEADQEIGVEAVRDTTSVVCNYPLLAPLRYVVVDGADRLTIAAANAFLKTLESASRTTRFFLLANSVKQVLPTVRSRCGLVRYNRLSDTLLTGVLRSFVDEDHKALLYARLAEGSVGRAVQLASSNRLNLRDRVVEILRAGIRRDLSSLFSIVDELGDDLILGLRFLELLVQDLLVVSHAPAKLINVDLASLLSELSNTLGPKSETLWFELRQVRSSHSAARINLTFHLKAALATVFS
jgi:DNA polymerase-3 subunit delta'